MTDILPPAPKFRIRRWVIASVISTSVVFGAISAVAVLFIADAFFDINRDPVVQEEQTPVYDAEFEQRLRALEEQAQHQPEPQQIVAEQADPTPQAAEAPVQDNRLSQIMVGLTQLRTAYENETSLDHGIQTLQQTITNENVREDLNALQKTAEAAPTKEMILKQVQELKSPEPQQAQQAPSQNWQDRAKSVVSNFVKVENTADLQQQKQQQSLLADIEQAVQFDNYGLAADLATRLPQSARAKTLTLALQARLKTQQLIKQTIATVSEALGQPQGSLY